MSASINEIRNSEPGDLPSPTPAEFFDDFHQSNTPPLARRNTPDNPQRARSSILAQMDRRWGWLARNTNTARPKPKSSKRKHKAKTRPQNMNVILSTLTGEEIELGVCAVTGLPPTIPTPTAPPQASGPVPSTLTSSTQVDSESTSVTIDWPQLLQNYDRLLRGDLEARARAQEAALNSRGGKKDERTRYSARASSGLSRDAIFRAEAERRARASSPSPSPSVPGRSEGMSALAVDGVVDD